MLATSWCTAVSAAAACAAAGPDWRLALWGTNDNADTVKVMGEWLGEYLLTCELLGLRQRVDVDSRTGARQYHYGQERGDKDEDVVMAMCGQGSVTLNHLSLPQVPVLSTRGGTAVWRQQSA